MEDKLQQLTEKIYNEGVSKAKKESDHILEDAKIKAEEMINDAKEKAEKILSDARKKAEDQKNAMTNDLKLSSRQAIEALKQEISENLLSQGIQDATQNVFNDKEMIAKIILLMAEKWDPNQDRLDLAVTMPENLEKDFLEFIEKEIRTNLDKGVKIQFSEKLHKGFEIGPGDHSYKISFSEEDFDTFIKMYMSPKLNNFLFNTQK